MVGEGVLHECLLSNEVEQVLIINRKTCGIVHPKVFEAVGYPQDKYTGLAFGMGGKEAAARTIERVRGEISHSR